MIYTSYSATFRWFIPQLFANLFRNFLVFSWKATFFKQQACISKKFPIFAFANSGEIDLARESAFFALLLTSELGHFTTKRGIMKGGCFRCCVWVLTIPNINSGVILLSIFFFSGSPSPTGGNKDKFGRLRSVYRSKHAFWVNGQTNPDAPDGI